MSGASKKLMGTTAAGADFLAVEDVFSTYLYTGNDTDRDIVNGIDLASNGGLVWIKSRQANEGHRLIDSEWSLSANQYLDTASATGPFSGPVINAFNSDGFNLDSNWYGNTADPLYGGNFTSWTFRKAPRFFDVVTWTGDGTGARSIPHNLGVAPACIIFKNLDFSDNWYTYHRGITSPNANWWTNYVELNTIIAAGSSGSVNEPTDTHLNVSSNGYFNGSGARHVAYLFAHDPLGPSGDGSDGLIACGSFTTDGSANATVELGWEPQWVLVKSASNSSSGWMMFDTSRGWFVGNSGNDRILQANQSFSENSTIGGDPTPTGMNFWNFVNINTDFIYIAIRRGPMRQPTSGTEVFDVDDWRSMSSSFVETGFPVDLTIWNFYPGFSDNSVVQDRLRGVSTTPSYVSTPSLYTNSSKAEDTLQSTSNYNNSGHDAPTSDGVFWNFRRAPGFFDVVAYTGDGASLGHNLAVTPELIIVKNRGVGSWRVTNAYSNGLLYIEATDASNGTDSFQTLTPCNEATMNLSGISQSGNNIAYLFATLPGVSKVGSYTGNGSSQTIDCGFTSGARFVLIKRTDSTGDWYVWDTARGIVTGNDPHLSLNTTAAEVTTDDSIDPASSGFIVNQVAATNINVSSASYIFLAIA